MRKKKKTFKNKVNPNAIDLHGNTVNEAIERLEIFINKSIMSKVSRIEIVHGKGTGKLQKSIHKYLDTLDVISQYKLNEINTGVTIVYL